MVLRLILRFGMLLVRKRREGGREGGREGRWCVCVCVCVGGGIGEEGVGL